MVSTAGSPATSGGRWPARGAGGLLVTVGAINAVLGLWALVSGQLEIGPGIAGGLTVAGLVTIAAGVLVSRGSRIATLVTLTIFSLLLVVQLIDLPGPATDTASALARLVVLLLLVIALGFAAAATRRRERSGGIQR